MVVATVEQATLSHFSVNSFFLENFAVNQPLPKYHLPHHLRYLLFALSKTLSMTALQGVCRKSKGIAGVTSTTSFFSWGVSV
jgi:hypothetical protein